MQRVGIPLRLLTAGEWRERAGDGHWHVGSLQVGDCALAPWLADWQGILSPEYERDWRAKRPPFVVVVPGPEVVCPDFRASERGTGRRLNSGWLVTGELPRITVNPSIDLSERHPGGWHGWIRDGQIA